MNIPFLLDGPADAERLLLLAHGAGAPMDSPFLEAIARGVAATGVRVARFEFPYMADRRNPASVRTTRRPPDPGPKLKACFLEAITAAAALDGGRSREQVAIGGKSMGGRIASLVADEAAIGSLVCLGYPFHPPRQPEKTRVEHLKQLITPTLIVQGERDPFGGPLDVAGYTLSPAIRMHWLADADHSFATRRTSARTSAQTLEQALAEVSRFLLR